MNERGMRQHVQPAVEKNHAKVREEQEERARKQPDLPCLLECVRSQRGLRPREQVVPTTRTERNGSFGPPHGLRHQSLTDATQPPWPTPTDEWLLSGRDC